MARVRRAPRRWARRLRERVANCSVRTAFALYAAAALLAGIALSFVSTGLLGLAAEATLPEDPYAYAGTYVYDAASNELVPAEALSWYEMPAYEALAESGDAAEESAEATVDATDVIVLYVESHANQDARPVPVSDPPEAAPDGEVVDLAWWSASVSDVTDRALSFEEIPVYDVSASTARPGAEEAVRLAQALPANAEGERPVVSNVGYYLPYPGDPGAYRAFAWAAIASVPAIFVACLVVAGRRFYRARLAGQLAAMDEAARRIAASDLDFHVEPQRPDELGRLAGQLEAMRAELERTEGELWRAAENRRQVNAAFAHDLRTPLTVIRGQAELVGRMAETDAVRAAAATIVRQAERLAAFADSMRGLDALESAQVTPEPMDPGAWLDGAAADGREIVRAAGARFLVTGAELPPLVRADGRALSRIADNLVANAARYARSEVRLSLSWGQGALELAVSDDGPGFAATALARAAEPFWGESKGTGGHLGLGLYVARTLAERHGGRLELSNRAGGGALVRARILAPEVS
ncbi:HAMP domain-containing histidine kinase [Olsenella uli]|uniref:ATP-binding protein n=1 Tax=Olsenella uli TaxID=133926 RepID=UPI00195F10F7|nr:HAMP domain-containing histidine kinase [Olsenella uli]